jgi:hypothetical protein
MSLFGPAYLGSPGGNVLIVSVDGGEGGGTGGGLHTIKATRVPIVAMAAKAANTKVERMPLACAVGGVRSTVPSNFQNRCPGGDRTSHNDPRTARMMPELTVTMIGTKTSLTGLTGSTTAS